MNDFPMRATTYDERATWGTCPVCSATHGQKCDPSKGIPLGQSAAGGPPEDGVHLGRLSKAPMRVQLVPVP